MHLYTRAPKKPDPFYKVVLAIQGWDPVDFEEDPMEQLNESKILVVGAGGLGCEILKVTNPKFLILTSRPFPFFFFLKLTLPPKNSPGFGTLGLQRHPRH